MHTDTRTHTRTREFMQTYRLGHAPAERKRDACCERLGSQLITERSTATRRSATDGRANVWAAGDIAVIDWTRKLQPSMQRLEGYAFADTRRFAARALAAGELWVVIFTLRGGESAIDVLASICI